MNSSTFSITMDSSGEVMDDEERRSSADRDEVASSSSSSCRPSLKNLKACRSKRLFIHNLSLTYLSNRAWA